MKKIASLLLLLCLLLPCVALTACGPREITPIKYREADLGSIITLPDYRFSPLDLVYDPQSDRVTDSEVEAVIEKALRQYAKRNDTDPNSVCAWGDTVGITYKGVTVDTLRAVGWAEDGSADQHGERPTKVDIDSLVGFPGGTTTKETELLLGSGAYIPGFEEGLVGHRLGEDYVVIPLSFPDDYPSAPALQGMPVVFFVSIAYRRAPNADRELCYGDEIVVSHRAVLDSIVVKSGADLVDIYTLDMLLRSVEESAKEMVYEQTQETVRLDENGFLGEFFPHNYLLDKFNLENMRFGDEGVFEWEAGHSFSVGTDGSVMIVARVDFIFTVRCLLGEDSGLTIEQVKNDSEAYYPTFCEAVGTTVADHPTYDAFFADLKKAMQQERDLKTDLYTAAFAALIDGSRINLSSPLLQGTFAYYATQENRFGDGSSTITGGSTVLPGDGTVELYPGSGGVVYQPGSGSIVLQPGGGGTGNGYYVEYGTATGGSFSDLMKPIVSNKPTSLIDEYSIDLNDYLARRVDYFPILIPAKRGAGYEAHYGDYCPCTACAGEFVSGRLAFWQYVKAEGITLSAAEAQEGLARLERAFGYEQGTLLDSLVQNGFHYADESIVYQVDTTKEDYWNMLCEALLWDKAAQHLIDFNCRIRVQD